MTVTRLTAAALAGSAVFSFAGAAQAAVFTSQAAFNAAAGPTTLIENFEDSNPALRNMALASYNGPGGEISFTGEAGTPFPNVFLAGPGYNNFGAGLNPTTSVILTANGNEIIASLLTPPRAALGFNVFLNDSPYTVTFFTTEGDQVLTYDSPVVPGDNLGFAGVVTTGIVTGFRVRAVNGQTINTGIDNIVAGAPVPEPATWAMMIGGFGLVGGAMRRRSGKAAAAMA